MIERLEDTIRLFRGRLHWGRDYTPVSRNVYPDRPRIDSFPPNVIDAIRRRNSLDEELYRFAVQLLDDGLAGLGEDKPGSAGGRRR